MSKRKSIPGEELRDEEEFMDTMHLLFAVASTVIRLPLKEFITAVNRANLAVVNDVPIIGQYKEPTLQVAKEIAEFTLDYQAKVKTVHDRLVEQERRLRGR